MKLFIRNDDVGADWNPDNDQRKCNYIPQNLEKIVDICLENNIPITLSIIPNRLNAITANWLKNLIRKYPKFIEVAQHGYSHKDHGCYEFGSCRSYEEQYNDIFNGLNIMKKFGLNTNIFVPPHNRYDRNTLIALEKNIFKIISAKYKRDLIRGSINILGKLLKQNTLFGFPISYHGQKRNLLEVSVSVDFVKSYNPMKIKSEKDILNEVAYYSKYNKTIGLMTHHWAFNRQDLKTFQNIILKLKSKGTFKQISDC